MGRRGLLAYPYDVLNLNEARPAFLLRARTKKPIEPLKKEGSPLLLTPHIPSEILRKLIRKTTNRELIIQISRLDI